MIIIKKKVTVKRDNENYQLITLVKVDEASFVGICIDSHLTWNNHIRAVNKCVRRKVGVLFKLRHFVPQHTLIILYKSFIQSNIMYGIKVWRNTCKSYLNCLLLSQKMAMRAITFSPFRTPSKPLLKKTGSRGYFLNCINFPSVHLYLICLRGISHVIW